MATYTAMVHGTLAFDTGPAGGTHGRMTGLAADKADFGESGLIQGFVEFDGRPTVSAPSGVAGRAVLFYDETVGELQVSYNNGSFESLGGGGGSLTGTGSADKVAYWDSASNLTYNNSFEFDPSIGLVLDSIGSFTKLHFNFGGTLKSEIRAHDGSFSGFGWVDGLNFSSVTGNIGFKGASGTKYAQLSNASGVDSWFLPSAQFGIGTTSPASLLTVSGNVAVGSGYVNNEAPANGMLVEGNVGIGTTTPQNELDVEGAAVIGASYAGASTAPSNGLLVQGNVGIGVASPVNTLDVEGKMVVGSTYSGSTAAPSNGMLIQGNVGIGTGFGTPASLLSVSGGVTVGSTYADTNAAPSNGMRIQGDVGIAYTGTVSHPLHIFEPNSGVLALNVLLDSPGYSGLDFRVGGTASAAGTQKGRILGHNAVTDGWTDGLNLDTPTGRIGFRHNGGTKTQYAQLGYGSGLHSYVLPYSGSGFGVGVTTPASLLSVSGGVTIGSTLAASTAAPSNGLLVQGEVHIDGAFNHDGTTVGFFNTAPVAKPTVTGSRGGNAALASLLTALSSLGLLTDSTTA